LVASLFDEFGGGFIDVVRVHHASIQGVEFATDGEDAFLEAGLVFIDDFGGNVEVKLMTDESEAQTARLAFATNDAANTGKFGGEELVVVDERIIAIEKIPFAAFFGGEFLQESANLGDDGNEIIELGGRNFVEFEASGPFGSNQEAIGPAERLPDSFGDKRSERMKHF